MVTRQFAIDALVELAVAGITDVESLIAAIIFRQLLLDDVRLNGDAEMVSLAGQVGR